MAARLQPAAQAAPEGPLVRVSTLFLRRLHKWVGLVLGLQFLVWTLSGAAMALLDMETVAGGAVRSTAVPPPPAPGGWDRIRQSLGERTVTGIEVRPLLDRHVVEVATPAATLLFDAADGRPVRINAQLAARIAAAAHPGGGAVRRVAALPELTLEVREHALPIWRVDFEDEADSSFYVSAATGRLLERRNDSWRLWDFAWMLHNMDYANRTSFNHPLIVFAAIGILWLAVTGVYLLFRTAWRPDVNALRRLARRRH